MIKRVCLVGLAVLSLMGCGSSVPNVTPDDILAKFKAAGLEAESATPMQIKDYGAAPLLCQNGATHFLIPSLCSDCGAHMFVCDNSSDAIKLKMYYDNLGKASAILHSWTYQHNGVILQINGDLDQSKADQYGEIIENLK